MTTITQEPVLTRDVVEELLMEHGAIGRELDAEIARQVEIEQEAAVVNARVDVLLDRLFALSARINRFIEVSA